MDYIILDTPPMGMTADAEELAEYADAAVLSVRQDGVLTRDINDAIDALNQKEEKGDRLCIWKMFTRDSVSGSATATVMDMDTAPTAGQNDKREQRA